MIQYLPISSDNYLISWDLLNNRYNNKRLILSSVLDLMLKIPGVQQLSLYHIKEIHDVTRESFNAIKSLGVDVDSWDPLSQLPKILHWSAQWISLSSKRAQWGNYTRRVFIIFGEDLRPWKLTKKLINKMYKNESIMKQSSTRRSIAQLASDKNVYVTKCFKGAICKTNSHRIYNCNKFRDMPL